MGAVNRTDEVTVGAVARRLGVDIDAVLKLVYDGELEAHPEATTGRLLVTEAALSAFEDHRPTDA